MKKHKLIIIGIILVVFGGYYFFNADNQPIDHEVVAENWKVYINSNSGIAFSYPEGYFVEEVDIKSQTDSGHVFGVILTEDNEANRNLRSGEILGEGPIAITFDVFNNLNNWKTAEDWARGANESNYKLGDGKTSETTVGDKEAVGYSWDGLYMGRSVVFLNGDHIIMASVTRLTPADKILEDFEDILKTVTLTDK